MNLLLGQSRSRTRREEDDVTDDKNKNTDKIHQPSSFPQSDVKIKLAIESSHCAELLFKPHARQPLDEQNVQ